jgi:hypothetical protein
MLKETTIRDWEHFDDIVMELPYRHWLFRGHSDANWTLKTSLHRLFEDLSEMFKTCRPGKVRNFGRDNHEKAMVSHFKANAHLYLKTLPSNSESNLEWLSNMQHFGCPTRLLDATASAYIALYFAIEIAHTDAAVLAFNSYEFSQMDEDALGKDYRKSVLNNIKDSKAFIMPFEPKQTNERLVAQQGAFLVPSNNYETLDKIIENYKSEKPLVKKLIIPATMRLEGIKRLRNMNITAASLFPGLDGFCRSLRDQAVESYSQMRRFDE